MSINDTIRALGREPRGYLTLFGAIVRLAAGSGFIVMGSRLVRLEVVAGWLGVILGIGLVAAGAWHAWRSRRDFLRGERWLAN